MLSEFCPDICQWADTAMALQCLCTCMGKIDVITYKYVINIDHYMAFFISYPLSALGHDISPRGNRLKG
jgi:hypothetical protein